MSRNPRSGSRGRGPRPEIDLVVGGVWRVNVTGEGFASGRVVEVIENERVVFTWGWEQGSPVPPGSTTVAIELVPDGDGTVIRLTHSALPPDQIDIHRHGWEHYDQRLAEVSSRRDPGQNRPAG
jgi:uncharacterized protein YndB with AHSA1/START domain